MYKCILWGTGITFTQNINLVKYYECIGHIKVVGITSNDCIYDKILDWQFINKSDIENIDFDLIIIMEDKRFREIEQELLEMGIADEKYISYRVLNLPNLNLRKYMQIRKNPPTIFANNCWGGVTYHSLGLQFMSPFINMFIQDEDYLKLLSEPQKYIDEKLCLCEERYNEGLNINYPICSCLDIKLYFNHYESFELANECWERRKKRINWNNLFVMMQTKDKRIAERFSELPYLKKICFVPFEQQNPNNCYINYSHRTEKPFWAVVNGIARGRYLYYDVVELLSEGEIKIL